MTDPARTSTDAYAQVRIREPLGERTFGSSLTIGAVGCDVVLPGVGARVAVQIERQKGVWVVVPHSHLARLDGRLLSGPRDLRRHDVIAMGDAQVVVTDASRTLLRLDVRHLVGNATASPAGAIAAVMLGDGDDELEIQPPAAADPLPARQMAGLDITARRRLRHAGALLGIALAVLLGLFAALVPVSLDIQPGDARVRAPATLVAVPLGRRLFVFPGRHTFRAERAGYVPSQVDVLIRRHASPTVHLKLLKLPGKLDIDTGNVRAAVSVDGVEVGRAPGVIAVSPGQHTVMLRAERHVDYITTLDIEGAGRLQLLKAPLQPSWGTLQISSLPPGARVSVDGTDEGLTPVVVDAPSGVRRVRISSPALKTWESSVVLKAGEALMIGPVALGKPDAHLSLRSAPAGADVTIGGTLRGRTPLEIDLPAGIAHEVTLNLPGYAAWTRSLFAKAASTLTVTARLELEGARVTVQGEPEAAELLVDGIDRGRTPQSLQLSATEHTYEIRKPGWVSRAGRITPAKGLDRTIRYHLISAELAASIAQKATTLYSATGYQLRLVPVGTFRMGAAPWDADRRPNESYREVTLKRPFYLGVTEVTNEQFRRFRPAHSSGTVERRSIDLDDQPVTRVTWMDAVEFCNWLSEQDSLPPAYTKSGVTYALVRPVTIGYRLPTEAEWEYAARYAGPGEFRRFAWGDTRAIAAGTGNLAGAEAASVLPLTLPGYRDGYPVVAPVGQFKATPLGLHDLSGNVSEWVNDEYEPAVAPTRVSDPLGPSSGTGHIIGTGHVIRGANWKSAALTDLRLAARAGASAASQTLGFRVARYEE